MQLAQAQEYSMKNNWRNVASATTPVPDAVAKAFHKLVPVADDVEWQCFDCTPNTFEVGFRQNGLLGLAKFDATGIVQEYKIEVKVDTLPPPARRAIVRRLTRKWVKRPVAVIRVLVNAECEKGVCVPIRWFVTFYSSEANARTDARSDHFYVSKTGHISEPQFR